MLIFTHSGVVESESIERQLKIEVFVNLRNRGMNVMLVITIAIITTSVKETVQEFTANLPQTSLCKYVGTFTLSHPMGRRSISCLRTNWKIICKITRPS